ncbi:MFS transporter [Hymenobacter sp. UV11]|uniref:MFS transporter n=1 Tax=Hymenobacter sp. UV11 TaxID=1849735 RepID=UPI00105B499F|nr:MFS transporter [Hymenobacter sp. UV11]TDN39338.1 MFS transporter [Hymenobacter sp. UV11]TFZ65581.1 MFS transporter [Hymenobacter sp. UV11]
MTATTKSRVAVSAFFFLPGLCFASWASRIPDISAKLGMNSGQLGQLLLAIPAGSLVSLPLAGWLVSTWGSRRTLLLASVLYACFLPLLGWAGSFWTLAPALALFGFAGNMLNISVNTQAIGVQQYYGKPVMGSFHGLWSLAGFLGGALGTLLIGLHQPPLHHFFLVLGLCLALAAWAYGGTLRQDVGKVDEGGPSLSLRRPDPYLLRIGLIAFCGMMSEGAMFDWAGVYFQKVVRPDAALVTAGYVACMSTMALGRFLSDYFTHRFGTMRMLQASSLLIVGGLALAVGLPYLVPAVAGFLLIGFGIASVVPLSYSAAGRATSVSPGVALALVSTIGFLGFLLGPPLIGFLAQLLTLRVAFGLVAVVAAGIGVLASLPNPVPVRAAQPVA